MPNPNDITRIIIGESIEVHKKLRTAARESAYERLLAVRLRDRGLQVERQVPLNVNDNGVTLAEIFRLDLVVERSVAVEIKRGVRFLPAHKDQLLTYLRVSGLHLGLLIDFGRAKLVDGVIRVVNDYDGPPLTSTKRKAS